MKSQNFRYQSLPCPELLCPAALEEHCFTSNTNKFLKLCSRSTKGCRHMTLSSIIPSTHTEQLESCLGREPLLRKHTGWSAVYKELLRKQKTKFLSWNCKPRPFEIFLPPWRLNQSHMSPRNNHTIHWHPQGKAGTSVLLLHSQLGHLAWCFLQQDKAAYDLLHHQQWNPAVRKGCIIKHNPDIREGPSH